MSPLPGLAFTVISMLPEVMAFIRARQALANPGTTPPTEDEIKAALASAVQSSIAKDDAWLSQHPARPTL